MVDPALPLPGLSPVAGKEVVARFDGGRLSSDGSLLVLREIERRLGIADRLAACIADPRDPGSTVHPLADIIRFRLLMIVAEAVVVALEDHALDDGDDLGACLVGGAARGKELVELLPAVLPIYYISG